MNNERLLMFNPFNISEASVSDLQKTYENIERTIVDDEQNPFIITRNIEAYSNLYAIVGELIARYQKFYDDTKVEVDDMYNQKLYELRNIWIEENEGKVPAMAYFEAQASNLVKDKYLELNNFKYRLKSVKHMFESIDQKINALKKKYEATKYAIGIGN